MTIHFEVNQEAFSYVSIQHNFHRLHVSALVNGAVYLYMSWCSQVYLVQGITSYGFLTELG